MALVVDVPPFLSKKVKMRPVLGFRLLEPKKTPPSFKVCARSFGTSTFMQTEFQFRNFPLFADLGRLQWLGPGTRGAAAGSHSDEIRQVHGFGRTIGKLDLYCSSLQTLQRYRDVIGDE